MNQKSLKEHEIQVDANTSITVDLIEDGGGFVVRALEWTKSQEGSLNTRHGKEKIMQIFASFAEAEIFFDDVIEKWS